MTPPTPPAQDALDMLQAEHQAILALFAEYRQLAGHEASLARRKALAEQICMELTIHSKLEDELLYPLARDAIRDDDLLDEAEVEHASCRDLIGQILAMRPADSLYDARVTVLGEYVEHHVREEQSVLFARLRKCGRDMGRLARLLAERRRELEAVPEALREEALVSVAA